MEASRRRKSGEVTTQRKKRKEKEDKKERDNTAETKKKKKREDEEEETGLRVMIRDKEGGGSIAACRGKRSKTSAGDLSPLSSVYTAAREQKRRRLNIQVNKHASTCTRKIYLNREI